MNRVFQMTFIVFLMSLVLWLSGKYYQNRELFRAIENNDFTAAQYAVEKGAFVNARRHVVYLPGALFVNPTPLIEACRSGNQRVVELLLTHGADVNRVDNYTGETPLLAALNGVKENRFSLSKYLIENGADIHATQEYDSPFYRVLAVYDQDSEDTREEGFRLFQYLMEHNVDMNVYMTKENALTHAAHYQNHNVVKYLIENGYYDINECDDNGDSALIVASKYCRKDIAEYLLAYGADKTIRNKAGKSAIDYAREVMDEQIIAALSE